MKSKSKVVVDASAPAGSLLKFLALIPDLSFVQSPGGPIIGGGQNQKIVRIFKRLHTQLIEGGGKIGNPQWKDAKASIHSMKVLRKAIANALRNAKLVSDPRLAIVQQFAEIFNDDVFHATCNNQLKRQLHDVNPIREILAIHRNSGHPIKMSDSFYVSVQRFIVLGIDELGLKSLTSAQEDRLLDKIQKTVENHFSTPTSRKK
jgi:hypothetical protein